jgi:hypothetical protein
VYNLMGSRKHIVEGGQRKRGKEKTIEAKVKKLLSGMSMMQI